MEVLPRIHADSMKQNIWTKEVFDGWTWHEVVGSNNYRIPSFQCKHIDVSCCPLNGMVESRVSMIGPLPLAVKRTYCIIMNECDHAHLYSHNHLRFAIPSISSIHCLLTLCIYYVKWKCKPVLEVTKFTIVLCSCKPVWLLNHCTCVCKIRKFNGKLTVLRSKNY